jgi:hypothetical protein
MAALASLAIVGPAGTGLAVDGVVEINQASALAGGVNGSLASDPAGFPVVITASGSYRLTGNLTATAPLQSAIEIEAKDVTIDLNGFTIEGNWTAPQACGSTVAGVGIHSDAAFRGNAVVNGRVRGMYVHGVVLEGEGCRIERVIAEENCVTGLWVGRSGLVSESQALRNATGHGIVVNGGHGLVVRSVANNNGLVGINFALSALGGVAESVTINNGTGGIFGGGYLTCNNNNGTLQCPPP